MELNFKGLSILIFGILILLNIFGYNPPASGLVYTLVTNNTQVQGQPMINYTSEVNPLSDVEGTSIWFKLIVILGVVATVGVTVGTIWGAPPIEYVSAGFIVLLLPAVLVDMLWLLVKFWSFGTPWNMFGIALIAPMLVLLLYSAYEYWRNG